MTQFLTYAIDKNTKDLVYIDDVPNGESCGCLCPCCNSPLIAKNEGKHNLHHFAHVGGSDCVGAYESALHLMAKEVLCKNKMLRLPKYPSRLSRKIYFQEIRKEYYDKELMLRPDCIGLTADGQQLWIEFKRTHQVDSDKRTKIINGHRECVEIDINSCQLDPAKMRVFIEDCWDNRKWIYIVGQEILDERKNISFLGEERILYNDKNSYLPTLTLKDSTNKPKEFKTYVEEPVGARHLVLDAWGNIINLGTVYNISKSYRCISCGKEIRVSDEENCSCYFVHNIDDEKLCSIQKYLRLAARKIIYNHFLNDENFYIQPFDEIYNLKDKHSSYTLCVQDQHIEGTNCSFDLALLRKGIIDKDSIYIYIGDYVDDSIKNLGFRIIHISLPSEKDLIDSLLNNDHLRAKNIEYINFKEKKLDKNSMILTFSLHRNGMCDCEYQGASYFPTSDVVYEIRFMDVKKQEWEAKQYAVLKCIEDGRNVFRCMMCEHVKGCSSGNESCSIGNSPDNCMDFSLKSYEKDALPRKYGKAKIEEIEY